MDDEVSTALKRQIEKSGAAHPLVEPHDHGVNAAERAIRTFKNHFDAGSCSTDPHFLISQWHEFLEQATSTPNLLQTSRMNPPRSAHADLFGDFDFNKTHLAPPGTQALTCEDPDTRESWAPHGKEGWHIGPAMDHHRCFQFHVPETGGMQISGTAATFPKHTTTPKTTPVEEAAQKAQNMLAAMQEQANVTPTNPKSNRHLTALKQSTGVFQCLNTQKNVDNPSESPRVSQTKGPISTPCIFPRVSDATSPRVGNTKWSSEPTRRINRFLPQPATHKCPTRNRNVVIQTKSSFAGAAIKHWFDLQDVCEKCAHMVLDPITGKPQNSKNLCKNPTTRKLWVGAMSKELGWLSQGIDGVTKGADCSFFVTHKQIMNTPKDRTVTHARIFVDCRP